MDQDQLKIISSLLQEAIKYSNKEQVKYILDQKTVDLNKIVEQKSFLHYAVFYRDIEIIKLLLDNGAIVDAEVFPPFTSMNIDILRLLLTNYNANLAARDFNGLTYLHLAVENNLLDIVDILINKGADVNAKTFTNETVTQLAFQKKNEPIINYLLQCNVDVNIQGKDNNTLLHYAIYMGNIDFLKIIIDKGVDINIANKFGLTPLHLAILQNDIVVVKFLLECGANVKSKTLEKRYPLHLAIASKSIEVAELLLENGAGIEDRTEGWITPLHTAVDTGNLEMVKFLVNKNANINVIGMRNETPLNIAVAYEHEEIAKYLILNGATVNHLKKDMIVHIAVFNKNEKLVELLLNNNADLTVRYNDDRTALHMAADYKCSKITDMLLKKGANVNDQMKTGDTALHIAILNEDWETSKILLNNKPNIDIKNNCGDTPLYIAAEKGLLNMVIKLLRLYPNKSSNESALYFAVKGKEISHHKIILELLAYGFSTEFTKTCDYKKTFDFMEKSVCNGHSGIVEYLLRSGFDLNTPALLTDGIKKFKTLLHLAVDNEQLQIAKLLINHGSNVNAIDEDERTPIFYAIKRNNFIITKLLLDNKAVVDKNYELFFMIFKKGNHNIIQEFLSHYKDVNVEDEFGTTALHFAAWNRDEESIQLLFNKGARYKKVENLVQISFCTQIQSNIRDSYGEDALEDFRKNVVTTPLHIAARRNCSDIVEALLEHGFDVDCRDGCGRTPLHIASLYNNTGVIDVLMEFNCHIFAKDESGYTCIDYVHNSEHFISNLLLDMVFIFIHHVDNGCRKYCLETEKVKSKETLLLIIKYLALRCTNKKFIECYQNIQYLYEDCNSEIEELKSKTILNKISFYDLLIKSISTLALFLKNEKFLEIYKIEIYKNNFPLYKNILVKRIRRAKERKVLLNEAEAYFKNVLCLPDLVTNIITNYLYNKDLRCIKEVYELYL